MKIIMTSTRIGSPDGQIVDMYNKDREYEVPDALATQFIRDGWAYETHTRPVEKIKTSIDIIMDNLRPTDMTGWEKNKDE